MINVIISGGSGTRMWPLSRKSRPKQFYPLLDGDSLYEITVKRNSKVCDELLVVTNQMHYEYASKEDTGDIPTKYILEPTGRDTLPAIVLACLAVEKDDVILVTPADHIVGNEDAYTKVVVRAAQLAAEGNLVTFGIKPEYAETGYGYIEADGEDVRRFREKPDKATAKEYLRSGRHFWNSGIFCFKAGVLLDEVRKHNPEVYKASAEAFVNTDRSQPMSIAVEDMKRIPAISIDYGLMEKSENVKVVPASMDWTDLGSFDALYDFLEKDENGNFYNGKSISFDAKNNLFYTDKKLVAAIGVKNLILIESDDAILICKRGASQEVKHIVNKLKETDSDLL